MAKNAGRTGRRRPTSVPTASQRNEASFGLMDYNARYYSPVLGRFVSPDSVVPNPISSQGFNRYSYVENNPIRYTDSSGHCGPICWTVVALTVGITAYEYLSSPDIAYAPNDAMAGSDLPPSDLPDNEDALCSFCRGLQDGDYVYGMAMLGAEATPFDEIPGVGKKVKQFLRKHLNDTDLGELASGVKRGDVNLNVAADHVSVFSQNNVTVYGHALSQIQVRGFSPESVLDLYSNSDVHRNVFRTLDGHRLITQGEPANAMMGIVVNNDGGIVTVLDQGAIKSAVDNQKSGWISPLDDDYPDWLK